jgi:hypothetical protein
MMSIACLAVLLGACGLYGGGGDDCLQANGALVPNQELRNPDNGLCEAVGGGGGGCNTACGPCPAATGAPSIAPAWGACYGACEGLAETACLATASCHAAYQYQSNGAQTPTFWGCWELPPTGPLHGACASLDAATCSAHDDCISTYDGYDAPGTASTFDHCAAEPVTTTACAAVDCGPGNLCVLEEGQPNVFNPACVSTGAAGTCDGQVTCATVFDVCPAGTTRGHTGSCYTPYCIPVDECTLPACSTLATLSACTMRSDCEPIYDGYNCTCDPHGCTCQTETFSRCQAL